jgi:cytochrome o ubiquinol oxidase subunit 3
MSSTTELLHPGLNLGATDPETHARAEEVVFGFWVFLMSDFVLFALLFATYASMLHATAGGPGGKTLFDLKSAAIETLLLLTSSFTFGLASLAMKHNARRAPVLGLLALTLVLGLSFLGFEVNDFLAMLARHAPPARSGFLSAFFALVPTHGLHVLAGSIWIVVMMIQVLRNGLAPDVKLRLLRLGLFWHFLDIVWIAIVSLVYLQGLA